MGNPANVVYSGSEISQLRKFAQIDYSELTTARRYQGKDIWSQDIPMKETKLCTLFESGRFGLLANRLIATEGASGDDWVTYGSARGVVEIRRNNVRYREHKGAISIKRERPS